MFYGFQLHGIVEIHNRARLPAIKSMEHPLLSYHKPRSIWQYHDLMICGNGDGHETLPVIWMKRAIIDGSVTFAF